MLASIMRGADMPLCRVPSEPRCVRHSWQAMAIEPIPAEQDTAVRVRSTHDAQCRFGAAKWGIESGGTIVAERPHRKSAEVAVLSYVVGSASSAQRRHDLSAAGGRLGINTRASLMEHTKALGWCHRARPCRATRHAPATDDVRLLRLASGAGAGRQSAGARSVGARSMLNTSVSESARPWFPGDARRRPLEGGRGFLVVDSANPRHLWGSDERIFSVSYEGSAIASEFLGFFYFLGQA
jgi:hypothetical protein